MLTIKNSHLLTTISLLVCRHRFILFVVGFSVSYIIEKRIPVCVLLLVTHMVLDLAFDSFSKKAEGFGRSSMALSRDLMHHSRPVIKMFGSYLLTLYLLDVSYWRSTFLRYLAYTLTFSGVLAVAILYQAQYPILPLCIFTMLFPIYILGGAKTLFHRSTPTRNFCYLMLVLST